MRPASRHLPIPWLNASYPTLDNHNGAVECQSFHKYTAVCLKSFECLTNYRSIYRVAGISDGGNKLNKMKQEECGVRSLCDFEDYMSGLKRTRLDNPWRVVAAVLRGKYESRGIVQWWGEGLVNLASFGGGKGSRISPQCMRVNYGAVSANSPEIHNEVYNLIY